MHHHLSPNKEKTLYFLCSEWSDWYLMPICIEFSFRFEAMAMEISIFDPFEWLEPGISCGWAEILDEKCRCEIMYWVTLKLVEPNLNVRMSLTRPCFGCTTQFGIGGTTPNVSLFSSGIFLILEEYSCGMNCALISGKSYLFIFIIVSSNQLRLDQRPNSLYRRTWHYSKIQWILSSPIL